MFCGANLVRQVNEMICLVCTGSQSRNCSTVSMQPHSPWFWVPHGMTPPIHLWFMMTLLPRVVFSLGICTGLSHFVYLFSLLVYLMPFTSGIIIANCWILFVVHVYFAFAGFSRVTLFSFIVCSGIGMQKKLSYTFQSLQILWSSWCFA